MFMPKPCPPCEKMCSSAGSPAARQAVKYCTQTGEAIPSSAAHSTNSGGAFGGGSQEDYAQQLIELIQRTISPQTWDVNGGQGSMFYFRPLMALVVRATSEVHDDVGGLLEALRRAGP